MVRPVFHPFFKNRNSILIDPSQKKSKVSLFGFLSLGLIPIPILFVRYGPALRKRSRFIRESMRIEVEMRHKKEEEKLDRIEAHKLREGKDNEENAVISVESPQA